MNNLHNVEKAMQKFQQLAKDAQSNGDPVLAQNYLQHADHYLRRYNELNERKENISIEKSKTSENLQEELIKEKVYSNRKLIKFILIQIILNQFLFFQAQIVFFLHLLIFYRRAILVFENLLFFHLHELHNEDVGL